MQNKLCLILNIAPHYRESIFKMIENKYSCDWFFGENETNIKGMDTSALKRVKILHNIHLFGSRVVWRLGMSSLVCNKEYSTFLITGETFNISTWLLLLKKKLFFSNKRIYIWTHGWYGKETYLIKFLKKIFFYLSDGIFLYGNYAKKLMIREGFNPDKIVVIHNSLQYEQHLKIRENLCNTTIYCKHFNNTHRNLIFIGRLTPVKRLDLLISALSALRDQGLFLNLTLVGDGSEKESLLREVTKNKLTEQVWFYGACYDDYLNAELIYNADVCVSPGNVGLTAIHSMTFGTPVLTHNNFPYQMPEFETIIPGKTGDFFAPNNVQSMVDCIQKWFDGHPCRDTVRNYCYNEITNYWTPEYQMKMLEQILM